MKPTRRLWLVTSAAVLLAAACVAAVVTLVARGHDLPSAVGAVAATIGSGTTVLGLVAWVWQRRRSDATATPEELHEAADRLATVVRQQWRDEARARGLAVPSPVRVRWQWTGLASGGDVAEAVTVPIAGVGPEPVPGVPATQAAQLLDQGTVEDLHDLYAGLGSGRLAVLGEAGTGKTAAAILLLLAALEHRATRPEDERPAVPVPVLLPLANWDPEREMPEDWAARRIAQEYPFLYRYGKGQAVAGQLLDEGLVSLVLDGLDEMAGEHQEAAVAALAAPTAARVVVLARPEQYRRAAAREPMAGAVVELLPVDVATAAAYLRSHHAPQAAATWDRMAAALLAAPESGAVAALSTPLLLVLARETYAEGGDPLELLDAGRFPDAAAVEEHLLDRLVRVAYEGRGPQKKSKYKAAQAQRWLAHLARQMERHNTRELAWWRLWTWSRTVPFAIAYVFFAAGIAVVVGAVAAYPRAVPTVLEMRQAGGQVVGGTPVTVGSTLPGVLVENAVILAYLAVVVAIVVLAGGYGFAPSARRGAPAAPRSRTRSWLVGMCATVASLTPLAILGIVVARSDGDWLGVFLVLSGAAVGLSALLATVSLSGIGTGYPSSVRIAVPSARDLKSIIAIGLAGSVVVGFIDTVLMWSESQNPLSVVVRMLYWLAVGAFVGLLLGVIIGFVRAGRESITRGGPRELWRRDAYATVTAGSAFAVVATMISVLTDVTDVVRSNNIDSTVASYVAGSLADEGWRSLDNLVIWLAVWLVTAISASEVVRYAVATSLLWVRRRGPLRLLRFLEDARERQIIRRAGSVYEFRHARLQSRLAQGSAVRSQSASKRGAGEPSVSAGAAGSAR